MPPSRGVETPAREFVYEGGPAGRISGRIFHIASARKNMEATLDARAAPLTTTQWLILVTAAVTWGDLLPAINGGHSPWCYALLYGALPAIPLILIRPFLPESPAWRETRAAGRLKRPPAAELPED
jgi:hypothetical protein